MARITPGAQVRHMVRDMTEEEKKMAGWKQDDNQTKRFGGGPGSNAHRKAKRRARTGRK